MRIYGLGVGHVLGQFSKGGKRGRIKGGLDQERKVYLGRSVCSKGDYRELNMGDKKNWMEKAH